MLSAFRLTATMRRCAPVALDWAAITSKVSTDSGRAELARLRSEIADINKALDSVPAGEASVDFDAWRARIQTPGAVDAFEKAFAGLQVPVLEDTFSAALGTKFDAAIADAETHARNSENRITELEAEIEAVQAQKLNIGDVSVEDTLAANPDIAAEIEAELAENNWKP
eukprot:TRINITY_DN65_c0_g1_i1.p2 TRINITY_DN65_c0_g1~~TRINITY_DN65_c0_g1_i1.p2  ORF type:complete len:169 (+),score=55.43 TRINITY_DN65_c0_g1_i1:128-634(+)